MTARHPDPAGRLTPEEILDVCSSAFRTRANPIEVKTPKASRASRQRTAFRVHQDAPYALALFDVESPFVGLVFCPYCARVHSHFMRTIEPRLVRAPCSLIDGARALFYVLQGAPVDTVLAALSGRHAAL